MVASTNNEYCLLKERQPALKYFRGKKTQTCRKIHQEGKNNGYARTYCCVPVGLKVTTHSRKAEERRTNFGTAVNHHVIITDSTYGTEGLSHYNCYKFSVSATLYLALAERAVEVES